MPDVASYTLSRTMRGVLAATAVIAAVGLTSATAIADPTDDAAPQTTSEALQQFHQLSTKAEKLNEKFLKAKVDLKHKRAQLRKANHDLTVAKQAESKAHQQEERFRDKVDELADASYQGARFNKLSALLTGTSPQDFLDRASALDVISSEKYATLHQMASATQQAAAAQQAAADAKQRAQAATHAADQLVKDIKQQNQALQAQISDVKAALARLSAADRAVLQDPGDTGVYIGPPGAAGVAMEWALSQRGKPYVWGAAGPDAYDCSGLTMAAYQHAGIDLPHSSQAQSTMGVAVSRSNLQPGDLVFFGNPVHHVGIYVGDGKMVDAPNSGEVVRVDPLQSDYSGARRVAG